MADSKKALIADKVSQAVIDRLQEDFGAENVVYQPDYTAADIESNISGFDMVVVRSTEVTAAAVANAKEGVRFSRGGAGTDNLKAAKDADLPVSNTPGANADGVVDLQVGLLAQLKLSDQLGGITVPEGGPTTSLEVLRAIIDEREIIESDMAFRTGGSIEKNPARNETINAATLDILRNDPIPELQGQAMLITGATGNIGSRMVEVAKALGMVPVAVEERKVTKEYATEHGIRLVGDLDTGLAMADAVSMNVALNDETQGMLTQERFDLMKRQGAVVINSGRSGLIATGVTTDVPIAIDDKPEKIAELELNAPNLLVSTKRGAKTVQAGENVGKMIEEQVRLMMDGKPPIHVVNPDALREKSAQEIILNGLGIGDPPLAPQRPQFSSGPCAPFEEFDGNALAELNASTRGRSHRSAIGKKPLQEAIDLVRELLEVPVGYEIVLMNGSNTAAFQTAMWSALTTDHPVTVLEAGSFSSDWAKAARDELRVHPNIVTTPYGTMPDMTGQVEADSDVVFAFNNTTAGTRVDSDLKALGLPEGHTGLLLADSTSAVFAMDVPIDRLDVVTFSGQKALGSEAVGVLILSPAAQKRFEEVRAQHVAGTIDRPLFKIANLVGANGKFNAKLATGAGIINTPSQEAVNNFVVALRTARKIGVEELQARSEANLVTVGNWVSPSANFEFLAKNSNTRSNTSITIEVVDPWFKGLEESKQREITKKVAALLEKQGLAFDVNGYKKAPAGFRLWGGGTINAKDLERAGPALEWAYNAVKALEQARTAVIDDIKLRTQTGEPATSGAVDRMIRDDPERFIKAHTVAMRTHGVAEDERRAAGGGSPERGA